ncbi:MAG: zinc-dependent metalloprotease [Phycisphaerae bacterium]|nr:zinc-dependent metalloprotease [Phycisphaerae bacterium]
MRCKIINLVVSCFVILGCNAQPPTTSGTGPADTADSNATDEHGQWFDGNGDPLDETPDAFLEVDRFTLVADAMGGGRVEPPAGTYERGEQITLTAIPDSGWGFDHWEGDASGAEPVITITVMTNTVVVAWFENDSTDNGNDNTNPDETAGPDPGSDFASAILVELDANDKVVIEQTLVRASDVHVYDLGAMESGDRFIASCENLPGNQLDPMIALFDTDGYRVFWNDDADLAGGDYDSSINDFIHHDSDHHYIAVTSTDYADTTGDYLLTIEVQRGAAFPQVAGQTLVIDLDGAANVIVAGTNWGNFDPLDAGEIDPAFAGRTEELKAKILSVVQADYAPYDMTVLTTDDPTPTGSYTTLFLGGDSDELFGIANSIDFYNADRQDDAIVFALAFGGLSNDLDAMGQAIGNVISHEVGHILGLMHTTDVTELMDTTASADMLLIDQHFGTASVYDFPIGLQNAPLLLDESLGPAARRRVVVKDGYLRCGTCGAKLYKLSKTEN